MNSKPLALWLFLLAAPHPCRANEDPPIGITSASDVRALGEAAANARGALRLQGTVLLPPLPRGTSFVIADDTAAVYCEMKYQKGAVELKRGDQVAVTGHAEMGGFAPYVFVDSIKVLGSGGIPPPAAVTFDQLVSGHFDSQWVEVSGIVRRSDNPENSAKGWFIELATGGGRLKILFRDAEAGRQPVDAEVRLAGICFYQFSRTGQIINPLLVVPAGEPVRLVRPQPAEVPVRRVDRLMTFASEGFYGHRVRVSGVVTYCQPGEGFWMEENGRGLHVIQWEGPVFIPGERVAVTGFPVQGAYSPELEDATVERLAQKDSAPPVRLGSTAEALDHDAGLVRLDATLIEQIRVPLGVRLVFRDQSGDFSARLSMDEHSGWSQQFETGSVVRVTGICQVSKPRPGMAPGTLVPENFELILRSPADLEILRSPPWWNAERRARLLGATTAALGIIIGFIVWMTRRRLRQSLAARRQAEAEFAAILAERNRIAREIHDTLAQGLGAISVRLELVREQLPPGSEAAIHLAEASGLPRQSLTEARNSIWNMRSQALENSDLPGALAGVLDQLTEIDHIDGRFRVVGERFRLPPVTENNLLRIGQEAISNAVRHAGATRIEVTVGFSTDEVTIRVKDDGCGFDLHHNPSDGHHFGLVGLRERASELGALLHIESSPGHGTEVILDFPVRARACKL